MRSAPAALPRRQRAVQLWLLAVAALVFATVLVGGATRLTESGLSIVEWKPVTGTLPPFSAQDWQAEFEKYRQIPQYRQINSGMTLDEFKVIYWWEWGHRQLGRLVGVAFLVPFLIFLWRGWIERSLQARLWGIFALGAVQGAVGWWMVASGLADRVSVSQYRLAFHLTLACVIYAALLWTAVRLIPREAKAVRPQARLAAMALVALTLAQIYLGALVAGLDAGLIYNTWPLIDGALIPAADRLWFETPLWRNLFENTLMVQFNHRMLAYLLWIGALWHLVDVARHGDRRDVLVGALALAAAMTVQAGLGILTLVQSVPIGLALAHQGGAVATLTVAVLHAERLGRGRRSGGMAVIVQNAEATRV
jgi:cytochrome c oxidase assembly protein subunit 15